MENVILIILSALTVLFTLFLCIIAIVAFLGWRNLEDLKEKQKIHLAKLKKITDGAEVNIDSFRKEAKDIINELRELKKKSITPENFKEYEEKTEDLINKLNEVIRRAEDRVGDLKVTGLSSTATVFPSVDFPSFGVGLGAKICPFCGHPNYITTASGLCNCENCKQVY